MTEDAGRYEVETTFHVRYAETDAMGIVHHASYLVYFEEGRSAYIRAKGSSYAMIERSGYFLAVTDVQARYLRPAHYDDLVVVRCRLSEVRSRTLSFEYEIATVETGEVNVTGSSKHVCMDRAGNVVRIPTEWDPWIGNQV